MNSSIRLYSLSLGNYKTYLLSLLFILGNIALPQIAHMVPKGGLIFLPIYFFTLIAAYKYGFWAGFFTAVLSPLANNLLFGMPPTEVLPLILTKSTLLAVIATLAARYFKSVSLLSLLMVVVTYQTIGMALEYAVLQNSKAAFQDLIIGWPGMLMQVVGGFLVLKALAKY